VSWQYYKIKENNELYQGEFMNVTSNPTSKTEKFLKFFRKHYLKMSFILTGLLVLTVYQNCSNPKPNLSQNSGSSVTPTPIPPAPLGIIFTAGTIPNICTTLPIGTSLGGVDVAFTIIGGDPLQSFVGLFSMHTETINPDGSTFSTAPIGTLVAQYGQRGEMVVYHIPPVQVQIPPLVIFVTISALDPTTGYAPRLYLPPVVPCGP
jgi:hypothetical protein